MTSRYVWIGIAVGVFVAGIGIGYAVFINTYNPYAMMMGNPTMFNQMATRNPQFAGQYMDYMMQDPQLRQQMYNSMLQNQQFMYGMMGNSQFMQSMMSNPQLMNQWMTNMMQNRQFQQQYMGPWMMMQNPRFMGPMMHQWYGQNLTKETFAGTAVTADQVSIARDSWNYDAVLTYFPPTIQVSPGTTVTWTNQDYVVHTVTDLGGKFDSQLIQPQDIWKHTFDTDGTYNYFCTLHPWMKGTVIVS